MKKESIELALDIIVNNISNSNIDNIDKIELLLNLRLFLINYKDNIETLEQKRVKGGYLR